MIAFLAVFTFSSAAVIHTQISHDPVNVLTFSCMGESDPVYIFRPRTSSNGLDPHEPVEIRGNGNFTAENGIVGGSGTEDDPFLIANWTFDHGKWNDLGGGAAIRTIICIFDTTAHFIIANCSFTYKDGLDTYGIYAYNVSNGDIINNIFTRLTDAIFVGDSNDFTVENNHFEGSSIEFWRGFNISISHNTVLGAGSGIDLTGDCSCVIENICIDSISYGISVSGTNVSTVNNFCFDNKGDGILHSGDNANITGNICWRNREDGIFVHTSQGIIAYNNCSENGAFGIHLGSTMESQVYGNFLFANRKGNLFDEGGSQNDIHDNVGVGPDVSVIVLAVILPATLVTASIVIYKGTKGRKKPALNTPAPLPEK